MSENSTILEDPVCGMSVDSDDIAADYQGTRYAFCSGQCRDRFQSNPAFYTGTPNGTSKPGGQDIYESRVLKLSETLPIDIAAMLTAQIKTMTGIQYVGIYENEMEISFDPNQVSVSQIEAAITRSGETMGEEWAAILNHAIVQAPAGSTTSNQNQNRESAGSGRADS